MAGQNLNFITINHIMTMIKLYNIGFTQKTAEEFFEKLKKFKIQCLIDIRLNPNGQLSRFAFEKDLHYLLDKLVDGCDYAHRVDLAPKKELLKEVRDKSCPMNKDYRLFEIAFNQQLETESNIDNFVFQFGKYDRIVLLCSEPTPDKCHRRLVSDMILKKFSDQIEFGGNL